MDQSKLNPAQQAQLFEMLKASGQQPTSGGTPVQNGMPVEQQAAAPQPEPAPGSFKDDPQGAINYIMSKATGPQLQQGSEGLVARVPHQQPLLRLFGMKQNQPVNGTNFSDTAQSAGIEKFLPSGLARTPDGKPFVGRESFITALQAAQSFGDKTRADFFSYLGNSSDSGQPVTFNAANNKFFEGGKEVPAEQLQRLLNKVRPQLENGQANKVVDLLNAQSQLEEVKGLFDKNAVGPVQGRLYQASKIMGINLPDLRGMASITDNKARMRTVLASGVNDYIKAITGAQMSEVEARRIMAAMPDANAADEAFMPVLEQVLKITDTKMKNSLDVLETQGTVGVRELRNLATKNRRSSTSSSDSSGSDLSSPASIKAAFKSGKISREQAKSLLQGIK